MGFYVEGNQDKIVKKIMRDRRLSKIFMQWIQASPEEKKKFEFIQYDTGSIDIVDNRKQKISTEQPALQLKHE